MPRGSGMRHAGCADVPKRHQCSAEAGPALGGTWASCARGRSAVWMHATRGNGYTRARVPAVGRAARRFVWGRRRRRGRARRSPDRLALDLRTARWPAAQPRATTGSCGQIGTGSPVAPYPQRLGRLAEVLAAIDRACHCEPRIRDIGGGTPGAVCAGEHRRSWCRTSAPRLRAAISSGSTCWRICGHWVTPSCGDSSGGYFTPQPHRAVHRPQCRPHPPPRAGYRRRAGRRRCAAQHRRSGLRERCVSAGRDRACPGIAAGNGQASSAGSAWPATCCPQRLVGIDVMPACCGATEILLEAQLATRWSAHCGNVLDEVEYAQVTVRRRRARDYRQPTLREFRPAESRRLDPRSNWMTTRRACARRNTTSRTTSSSSCGGASTGSNRPAAASWRWSPTTRISDGLTHRQMRRVPG